MINNFSEAYNLKHIAILGSTGSIGTQALEVIRQNSDRFKVFVLTANNNADLLVKQALEFNPPYVVLTNESKFIEVKNALSSTNTKVLCGIDELCEVLAKPEITLVLTAMVGFAGLIPTLAAIKAGKDIALANKETLVVAGELVNSLAKEHGVKILPVDSEHSAIFQCLAGVERNPIEKIYLTASGGPFRGKDRAFLANVTKAQALKHPNWVMGAKITIDSASLMNNGLEVIEAKWLFNLKSEQIDVIVHPQSIVHSIAQFTDGSMKAQLGLPDMKLPIHYAFSYPQRIKTNFPRFDFFNYPQLTFEKPDLETFTNLALAFKALQKGGNMPCVLNAANEIVVQAFLEDKIGFLQMSDVIAKSLDKMPFIKTPTIDDYMQCDKETRLLTTELIKK